VCGEVLDGERDQRRGAAAGREVQSGFTPPAIASIAKQQLAERDRRTGR
jgi:hypothetical protein